MTRVKEDYIVGLDIGTNSCGWVATDMKNNILRLHGKNAIGSHLFEEGKSAADRRTFRTTRRRLKRRKWRLKLLEEIFDPHISQKDPYFFARMRESGLSPLDKKKRFSAIIFPTQAEEKKFHQAYPTIYHLRNALMTKDEKFDLHLVYLAIHHIVKYRGNFLQTTPVKDFEPSKINISDFIAKLNNAYSALDDSAVKFAEENAGKIENIIRDKTIFKKDKQSQIADLLIADASDNKSDKVFKIREERASKQIANAIFGYKTKFEDLFGIEISKENVKTWEFKLTDTNATDELLTLSGELTENQQTVVSIIEELFGAITLSEIVDEGKSLSQSMIRKYDDHRQDLKLLKAVIVHQRGTKKAKKLQAAYNLYINNRHASLLRDKSILKYKKGVLAADDFYKFVKANLDKSEEAEQILKEINLGTFMPKQRTNQNGVIPFQLHQRELDAIIAKQGKYYPFLKEKNPIEKHLSQAPYKLDELVRFRVPYYVGPMISPIKDAKGQGAANQSFAWMVRKADGRITPWNFDEKVDRMRSANNFIKRMTTKDTYLLGEDVLPKHSLLYQRFEVLNELNNIRINGQRISIQDKQDIYTRLFKDGDLTSVSVNRLTAYLKVEKKLPYVEIKGLADEKKFNSSLASYHLLHKLGVFEAELDNPKYQSDFERIIEWATIFEDRQIYLEKLKTIDWLSSQQIKALAGLSHFQGWGRLSKKLLLSLHDQNGQNIMEKLWDSQENFMQIVNQPDFKEQIEAHNQLAAKDENIDTILADAYTSPANKKAIRQVIKVVDDITRAASGKAPKQIAIEFARDAEKNPKLSIQRGRSLQRIYDQLSDEAVSEALKEHLSKAVTSKKLAHDKYYLYFMQLGRDAYSGKPINFDEIESRYQIDHILPQSFIKDDSLNNRVLVASELNNEKSDNVPVKLYANKKVPGSNLTIRGLWDKWLNLGLITKQKHNNLLLDPDKINKYQVSGFIRRQLVETSQIIKLVSTILQEEYPHSQIIVVKASYNHALRNRLNLYKSRSVNDYHHAIDAYLSTICGNFLFQVYPKLRPFFVYGQFKKFQSDPELEKDIIKHQKRFDFIWPLLKKDNLKDSKSDLVHLNAKQDGPVIFNRRSDIFDKLKRAYNFKYMLVSRETSTRDQEMFKMTLFPRKERDTKKARNLIPKSKNLPVEIYGGYSNNSDAYMAIVKIDKKKGEEYRVVGVPMRALNKLRQAKGTGKYADVLKEVLTPIVMLNKNGKAKRGINGFKVLAGRILYKQVIKDHGKKFLLGSSTYVYNAKQLALSENAMRIVTGNFYEQEDESESLIEVYKEIVAKVNRYLPLFDINGFRKKLSSGLRLFESLSITDKKTVIQEILNGLHDNPVSGNLKIIGIKTPFGRMQIPAGVTLSPSAELIYQSPTGLFEKRVKISEL